MNPKQIGDGVRALLLAAGVSSSFLGYFGDETWLAIGGAIFAFGVAMWQLISSRLMGLLKTVEKDPEVAAVIVKDEEIADALGPKVLSAYNAKVVKT